MIGQDSEPGSVNKDLARARDLREVSWVESVFVDLSLHPSSGIDFYVILLNGRRIDGYRTKRQRRR
jgi:hypothetical protein